MSLPVISTADNSTILPLPCPIPMPPGALNGTAFGPQDCITVDQILEVLPPNYRIDGMIIIVMQDTTIGNGMTPTAILDALEAAFPLTDWTIELVTSRLAIGKRAGRFLLNRFGVWYIVRNMAQLNWVNNVFTFLVSTLIRNPSCVTAIDTQYNGYFSGIRLGSFNESCTFTNNRLHTFLPSSFAIPQSDL